MFASEEMLRGRGNGVEGRWRQGASLGEEEKGARVQGVAGGRGAEQKGSDARDFGIWAGEKKCPVEFRTVGVRG